VALAAGATLELQVGGRAGVPSDAVAVVLNTTVTNPEGAGFLTAWPCGQPRPSASNLNYVTDDNVPNLVIAKLGDGGRVCLFTMSTTDVVVDVAGGAFGGDIGGPHFCHGARVVGSWPGDGRSHNSRRRRHGHVNRCGG
jgi:hypothetical protein